MKVLINPDKQEADKIIKKIKENDGFCPCRIIRNKDTRCMCKEFRDKIKRRESGFCHCGLYYIESEE